MNSEASNTHAHQFPNESAAYRRARNELLQAEQELRRKIVDVAKMRSELPAGGELAHDYEFAEVDIGSDTAKPVRFSELFGDKKNLLVYSYMFGPDWSEPCPSCTSLIDGLNAMSRHVRQQVEMVVVGKASPSQLGDIARERGWHDVRLLSSQHNDYTRDYLSQPNAETRSLIPLMNSFERDGDDIRHVWASETLWTPLSAGHPRHMDIAWPLWGLLDMTRSGRHPTIGPLLRY